MSPAAEENHLIAITRHHPVDNVKAKLASAHWRVVFEGFTVASSDLIEQIEGLISIARWKIAQVETIAIFRATVLRAEVAQLGEVDVRWIAKDRVRLIYLCWTRSFELECAH